jgi:hypothetical protein
MELTAAEGRVLGCLIEQEAVAPDAVPLTLNTLRLACNQTVGRDPVVAYDDRTVEDTLLSLKSRGLARFVPPSSGARTTRYRHRADERWRMGPAELAVLAVLLLGGVQTEAQVRERARWLHPSVSAAEVDAVLDSLAARTPRPFAARVGSAGGGDRCWAQVLTGPVPEEAARVGVEGVTVLTVPERVDEVASSAYEVLAARVADLEQRLVAALGGRAPVGADWPPSSSPYPVRPRVEVTPPARRLGPAAGRRVDDLADRVADIERRLARIEAELGALH